MATDNKSNERTVAATALPFVNTVDKEASLLAALGGAGVRASDRAVFVKRAPVLDLNEATRTGYYSLNRNIVGENGSIANLPDTKSPYGILLVFEDDTRIEEEFVQIVFTVSSKPGIYIRKKGSTSGWSAWYAVSSTEVANQYFGGG